MLTSPNLTALCCPSGHDRVLTGSDGVLISSFGNGSGGGGDGGGGGGMAGPMVAVAVAWRWRWWRWLRGNRVMMGSTSGHDQEGRGMILFIYF